MQWTKCIDREVRGRTDHVMLRRKECVAHSDEIRGNTVSFRQVRGPDDTGTDGPELCQILATYSRCATDK